eukprot:113317_1
MKIVQKMDIEFCCAFLFILIVIITTTRIIFEQQFTQFETAINFKQNISVVKDDNTFVFDHVSHWNMSSYQLPEVYINTKQRLLYCAIQKNCNLLFKSLFTALQNEDPTMHMTKIYRKTHFFDTYSKDLYKTVINNESWTRFIVIRDPLERLVSGFLHVCMGHGACDGRRPSNFAVFVDRIVQRKFNNQDINRHFRAQSVFCNLHHDFSKYNYVIKYEPNNIAVKTEAFLSKMDLKEYYMYWGSYHNQTMFENSDVQNGISHVTFVGGNKSETIQFYAKYYNKELAIKCLKLFSDDYVLFNLPVPWWIRYI